MIQLANRAFKGGNVEEAIQFWALAIRTDEKVWCSNVSPKLMKTLHAVYSDASNRPQLRADALLVDSLVQLYVVQFYRQRYPNMSRDDAEAMEHVFLEKALKRIRMACIIHPDDPFLLAHMGSLLYRSGQFQDAIQAFQEATLLGCTAIHKTLLERALAHDKLGQHDKCLQLLEEFVHRAEWDDCRLPSAYFCLSIAMGRRGVKFLGGAKRCFDLGVHSLRALTPMFLDWMEVNERTQEKARKMVEGYYACGNLHCFAAASFLCSKCQQVYYCSRKCQKNHRADHKSECTKTNDNDKTNDNEKSTGGNKNSKKKSAGGKKNNKKKN
jgi:tetratricopeptide (TPR) repeat protein